MAGRLGKYQMLGFTGWSGLTKDSHISSIFGNAPQKASNMMVQLLAANGRKTLETFLSAFPVNSLAA